MRVGIGIGMSGQRPSSGGAPPALILDSLSAGAAYSTRKLRTAYAGAAIRVRRSSDNVEADIGFVGNDLDTAALLSFCGAGSGFLVTRYDQVGTNNETQATTANQPRIVNAGVLEVLNSKAAPVWTGGNVETTHATISARMVAVVGTASASIGSLATLLAAPTLDNTIRRNVTQANGWRVSSPPSDYTMSGTTWINGQIPASVSDSGVFSLTDALDAPRVWHFEMNVNRDFGRIGRNVPTGRPFVGPLSEVIYFSSQLSTTDRQALEANQGSYWGITINP